jgi:hypothetical protein
MATSIRSSALPMRELVRRARARQFLHVTGIAHRAPGRARNDQLATAVAPRPLRSQSMKIRPSRLALLHGCDVTLRCLASPACRRTPRRTRAPGGHGCLGAIGTTTCTALAAGQAMGTIAGRSRRAGRAVPCGGLDRVPVDAGGRVEVEDQTVGAFEDPNHRDPRAPGMEFQCIHLHQRQHAGRHRRT